MTHADDGYAGDMTFVRYGLPAAIFMAGIVVSAVASDKETGLLVGTMFMGAAIAVLLLNLLYRVGVSGDRDREAEDARRRYFDQHGHWPDER